MAGLRQEGQQRGGGDQADAAAISAAIRLSKTAMRLVSSSIWAQMSVRISGSAISCWRVNSPRRMSTN
ncbi:hypothetical protein ASG47_08590 [Devosia sp. Leaf420]|nr:hypothetical protein ASG47_08590 [Devosia sp. Leaf420]